MIREFQLSIDSSDEHEVHQRPGILRVSVIGEDAHVIWEETGARGSFRVSARSLLLALRAAWDAEHPGTADFERRQRDRPANSHQPWTAELDAQLRDTWLAAEPPASARIGELARALGRSRAGIRARLARIGCDPDVPGRLLQPATAGGEEVSEG